MSAALALILVFTLALPGTVLADNVQDDVAASGNVTIDVGGETTISYWIIANGSDGCNVDTSNPATVTIVVDSKVSRNPS
jgi:hypothetical protein